MRQRRTALDSLFRALFPARGRHRAGVLPVTGNDAPTVALARVCVVHPELDDEQWGEGGPLVRPYVLPPEEWRSRCGRPRRALRFAPRGVDLGPHRIHGATEAGQCPT